MTLTLLKTPEDGNVTGLPVPVTGWWRNQHDEIVRFRRGAEFRACLNGERAVWVLEYAVRAAASS